MTELEILMALAVSLLAANLIATLWVNERIRGAIRELTRRTQEAALARLEAKREELARGVAIRPDEVLPKLGQLALEATGENAEISRVAEVVAKPFPAIVTFGKGGLRYIFSPTPPEAALKARDGLLRDGGRAIRVFPIDASTSGLTATAELAAVWDHLAEKFELPLEERPIQRSVRWYLYVLPPGRKHPSLLRQAVAKLRGRMLLR